MADRSTAVVEHDQSESPNVDGAGHLAHEEHPTSTGISNAKLGMWVFLASDCLLFGALISTYLLVRREAGDGPGPEEIFDIGFTSVSSFVLLMSSLTIVLAINSLGRGEVQRSRVWIASTAMLGAVFVAGQVYEFTVFVREGLGYTTSQFSSGFYTLTGFHGVHVTVGIFMLVLLLMISLRGNLGPEKAETLEVVGLYWHFVDIVWILIFAIVYLIP